MRCTNLWYPWQICKMHPWKPLVIFLCKSEKLKCQWLLLREIILQKIQWNSSRHFDSRCIISALCSSHVEHQWLNPTTQMALASFCAGSCTPIINITWNIYYGERNFSSNVTQWTPLNAISRYQNKWFFGKIILVLDDQHTSFIKLRQVSIQLILPPPVISLLPIPISIIGVLKLFIPF